MKYRTIIHIISVILLMTGLAMVLPLAISLLDRDSDLPALAISTGATLGLGFLGFFRTRQGDTTRWLTHREAYLATFLGWLAACLAGALPFYLLAHTLAADPQWVELPADTTVMVCDLPVDPPHPAREFCSFTDSFFESVSGFTTTGSSVIRVGLWDEMDAPLAQGRAALPRGILFWRSLIQWLGGMGILVLAVTVLSLIGVGGMHLMKAEVPGPTPGRLSPRIADTARVLWKVYLLISLGEVIALMLGGMDLYNALCHTCTTMATGGFSTLVASVGGMDSPYLQWVIIFFMLLAGANFTLHWALLLKRRFEYHRDSEFRVYLMVTALASAGIILSLYGAGMAMGLEPTLRHAVFQVVSVLTTTGYATQDYGQWPAFTQLLLLTLMFVGGCAGSTGGGMKVIRLQVTAKAAYRELLRIAHPRAVSPVRVGRRVVGEDMVRAIIGVVVLFVALFVISSLAMAAMGLDLITSISSVAACIGNVGPGLGLVGPAENFFQIPTIGKWVLIINMLAGRLEIYTVAILLSPHFWRR